jgi:methyl-accepting chemotaxis protein
MLKNFFSKSENVKENSDNYISKQSLLEVISDIMEGNTAHIEESKLGCSEVTKKWNEMISFLNNDKRKILLEVNSLMENITRMDSVKNMVSTVNRQTESLHSMSASSEELTASIQQVSSVAQQVSSNADKVQQISEKGVKNVSSSVEFVRKAFNDISNLNEQMEKVKEKTETINKIIDIVKGISDQTDLLALNAAIEAARAGEQGKGFSVVADEVRKLAEHTKNSVLDIQKNIAELEGALESSVTKINNTSHQLNSGTELVNEALNSINEISVSIDDVNGTITQVASSTEEQTSATETFTEGVMNISKHADDLSESCHNTGRSIFKVSKEIGEIRKDILKNENCLNEIDMIEIYKTDHLVWRWRVYNMLLGYEKVDKNIVGDYKNCKLGQWYYGLNCEKLKNHKAFNELEEPHIKLHEIAKEAVIAYERNDIKTAERALDDMDHCSKKVFECLGELKAELIKER